MFGKKFRTAVFVHTCLDTTCLGSMLVLWYSGAIRKIDTVLGPKCNEENLITENMQKRHPISAKTSPWLSYWEGSSPAQGARSIWPFEGPCDARSILGNSSWSSNPRLSPIIATSCWDEAKKVIGSVNLGVVCSMFPVPTCSQHDFSDFSVPVCEG